MDGIYGKYAIRNAFTARDLGLDGYPHTVEFIPQIPVRERTKWVAALVSFLQPRMETIVPNRRPLAPEGGAHPPRYLD